jgi:hypothetical protein
MNDTSVNGSRSIRQVPSQSPQMAKSDAPEINQIEAQIGVLRYAMMPDAVGQMNLAILRNYFDVPSFDASAATIAEVVYKQADNGENADSLTVAEILKQQGEDEAAVAALNFMQMLPTVAENRDFDYSFDQYLEAMKLHKQHRPMQSRFEVLALRQIIDRPRPLWLIRDIILEIGYSAITGDYGTFKSFIALDMGLAIATGRLWQGRETKRGKVIYIVAEGAYTTADRVKAWMIRHGHKEPPEDFHVIEVPTQIADPQICEELMDAVRDLKPVFIVLDTLAKCNVGKDENSSSDMGLFTDAMNKVSREFGAQVMAIHHNNKSGTARGSNSLPSNVDTHITLRRIDERVVTVRCDKQRSAPFEAFALAGKVVELGEVDEYGAPITSLVFDPTTPPAPAVPKPSRSDNDREKMLEILRAAPDGMRAKEWQGLCDFVSASQFYAHRKSLLAEGKISAARGETCRVTPITPITPIRSSLD